MLQSKHIFFYSHITIVILYYQILKYCVNEKIINRICNCAYAFIKNDSNDFHVYAK